MRFLLILDQKIETPRSVNTVFKLAVIRPICPFIAQRGGLRNRNKFDLLTEDDKPRQILVKNPVFLYFAVDDPFNSEMNATPAVIRCCPFHSRVQIRMGPCEAKAPKAVKCADCLTNSFASQLHFWLVAELLPWNRKKCSCSCFVHRKNFVLDLWDTAKPTVFAICTSPIIQFVCSPKL